MLVAAAAVASTVARGRGRRRCRPAGIDWLPARRGRRRQRRQGSSRGRRASRWHPDLKDMRSSRGGGASRGHPDLKDARRRRTRLVCHRQARPLSIKTSTASSASGDRAGKSTREPIVLVLVDGMEQRPPRPWHLIEVREHGLVCRPRVACPVLFLPPREKTLNCLVQEVTRPTHPGSGVGSPRARCSLPCSSMHALKADSLYISSHHRTSQQ